MRTLKRNSTASFPVHLCSIAVTLFIGACGSPRAASAEAIQNAVPYLAQPLPLSAVRLTGGPLKQAQDLDIADLLRYEPDRMLALLRTRAGLEAKAQPYGSWDGPNGKQLSGHIAGHYLSAVSLMYAATGRPEFKQRADYIVAQLKEVQDKYGDGYLGALTDARGTPGKELFGQIADGQLRSSYFDLNGMWSPWYVEHKIFAGLRDAWRYTGNQTALDVEIKFAGWVESIVGKLDDAQVQRMLNTEFGGMNEVLADLYADTGDKRWLAVSDRFEHKAIVDPLSQHQDILPRKHGNTQVPKMIGELARYIYTGNKTDGDAAFYFWDEVALHHSFATGGHGKDEYFGQPDKLNDMVDGRTAESCNVYNMLKMTRTLFALKPEIKYADFQERALFNHMLAAINFNDGQYCYMVPVGRGVTHEYQGNGFTCCVGTGMETHALHGDGIYYSSRDRLWINLYAPSTAEWKEAGAKLEMETDFPEGSSATLKITLASPKEFTLALRRPYWAGDGFSVTVNGKAISGLPKPDSYVEIKRTWKAGDTVSLVLLKTLWKEPLADNPNRVALMWGPLVMVGDLGPGGRDRGNRAGDGGSVPGVPVFVTAQPVANWLKPVAGQPAVFHTDGVGRDQDKPKDVNLIPFYKASSRTYAVYWDVFTQDEWSKKEAEYAAAKEKQRRIEAATIAYVQPGQMQPETDFNFRFDGEDTVSVEQIQDRYGRRGTKWFSFDVPVDPAHPATLIVSYSSRENANRTFNILVDGRKIAQETVERVIPIRFFDKEYPLPPDLTKGKQKVTVRFEAGTDSEIPAVFGLRMIRGDAAR
jgi:DUF1680 family protein